MQYITYSTYADDAYGDSQPSFSATAVNLLIGNTSASNYSAIAWIPFVVGLSRAANIVSATITFYAQTTGSAATANVKWRCEDVDNATAGTSYANLLAKTVTTAYTQIDGVGTYTAGSAYSVDVTTAVQEVLARTGWASGGTLAVMCEDNSSSVNASRSITAFEGTAYPEPKLTIGCNDSDGMVSISPYFMV